MLWHKTMIVSVLMILVVSSAFGQGMYLDDGESAVGLSLSRLSVKSEQATALSAGIAGSNGVDLSASYYFLPDQDGIGASMTLYPARGGTAPRLSAGFTLGMSHLPDLTTLSLGLSVFAIFADSKSVKAGPMGSIALGKRIGHAIASVDEWAAVAQGGVGMAVRIGPSASLVLAGVVGNADERYFAIEVGLLFNTSASVQEGERLR